VASKAFGQPLTSQTTSSLLSSDVVGERHYLLSVQVQLCCKSTESLKPIIAIMVKTNSVPSDRADYAKAKRL